MKDIKNFITEGIFGKKQPSYKDKDFKYWNKEVLKILVDAFKEKGHHDISNEKDPDKFFDEVFKIAFKNGLSEPLSRLYLHWVYDNFNKSDIDKI